MTTLENIINQAKIGEIYYILEKTDRVTDDKETYYSFDKQHFLNEMIKEKDSIERRYNFKLFSKKKEGFSFMKELISMNSIELINWLS